MSPHRQVLVDLVKKHGWTRGAELGVQKGLLFSRLLESCPDLHLTGVDIFKDRHHLEKCRGIEAKYSDRATLIASSTHAASEIVADHSFDFVFIDADHSASAVSDDIACWQPKVRPMGWLGGHDYNRKWPGVMSAVDTWFGLSVHHYPGSIWGVWL